MKYQRLVSNTTPASLQDWLEEELESRGIDGVYTRYILSLLQQDYLDLEPSECQHTPLSGQKKISQQYGGKEYMLSYSKSRHQKWKSWEKERLLVSSTSCCNCGLALDLEERKKSAAVECLKSASEQAILLDPKDHIMCIAINLNLLICTLCENIQKIGIEKLIDEVCIKLKNVKTSTAEECKEIADEGAEIESEELPPSSPQDQAEKYYAAFPALNGKTEPLTELCHQQSRDDALEGVWNARLLRENALQKPIEMHDTSSTNSEHEDSFDSAAEKENKKITCSEISKHDLKQSFKICSTEKNANDLDESPKPSFIVPKMKTSMPRKPFSVRYLPFNQLLKHTHDSVSAKVLAENEGAPDLVITDLNAIKISAKETEFNKDDSKNNNVGNIKSRTCLPVSDTNLYGTEKFNLEENKTKEQLFGNLFENFCDNCEKLGLLMCAAFSDVSQSHVCKDKNDSFLVEQLLSKFNSRLASIWRTSGQDKKQKEVGITDSHWQLFKLSSLETNDLEHDGSVWAFNKEDLEKINEHKWPISSSLLECGEATEILSAEALPELLRHIEASKHLFENPPQEAFCSTSLQSVTDMEEQENAQNTSNTKSTLNFLLDQNVSDSEDLSVDSDVEGILTAYSESFLPTLETHENTDHLSNVSSDRESATPDSLAGAVQGIYSLWKSSSDSTLMLGKDLKKIWDPSPMDESSNWLALPIHDDNQKDFGKTNAENFDMPSCSDVMQLQWNIKDIQNVQQGDASLSKIKCTLTYHKGESKFVEVIPSNKRKFSVTENDSCRSESQEIYQCDSVLSNTDYLSDDDDEDDDEENLLTSPKTHFQPIRQDSLDTENSDDVEVMMLTVKDLESPSVLKEPATEINITESSQALISETENYPEKLDSSKMKAIKCKTGSPIQKLSTNKVVISPGKERKRGRAISSSFEELISLTGQFPYEGTEVEFSTVEISSNIDLISFHLWKADQFKDKGTNTDTPSSPCLNNHLESHSILQAADSLSVLSSETYDESHCSPEVKVWNIKDYRKTPGRKRNLPGWKWSTSESDTVESNIWYHNTTSDWNNIRDIKEKCEVPRMFENNTDVNALRKEIKEEEDQLFRDISHLNNTCDDDVFVMSGDMDYDILVCNSNKDYGRKCNKLVHFTEKEECVDLITEEQDLLRKDFLGWNDGTESFSDVYREFYDRSFSLSDLDLEDGGQPAFPSVPADKILYSSDLEDEWRKNSQPFGVQVPRRRLKYKSPPQKRPCSFYLEGNCRRSDCRFSHDLSTITCRFWEEGSCFKGITCPFLHGYIGDLDCHEINGASDCNYTLESEADFPSLSAVKIKESETKSNPQDITSDKGNRPKRKKGKSQSGWSSQKIAQPVVSSSWPGCSSALESPDDSQE